MRQVRVGIVGCGAAAAHHSVAYRKIGDKVELVAAYDTNEKRAKRLAKTYGMDVCGEYQTLLSRSDVNAVIIALPHHFHSDATIAACEAGKHVLCEKPMAPTLEECDAMIKAAEKAGVKLVIAENHRFLPAHRTVQDYVSRGMISDVLLARAYEGVSEIPDLSKADHWKGSPALAGGGVLMDAGVHRFSVLRRLFGEVESVYCWLAKRVVKLENKAEDNAMMFLKFENGAIAEVVVSFTVISPPTNRLELYGTEGTILEDHVWEKPVPVYSTVKEMGTRGTSGTVQRWNTSLSPDTTRFPSGMRMSTSWTAS
ncbi:MAG: Gfo/Idh/MocA family protein [Candidatus Freyrarchaeum guaymaensis]|nr:Gfo/Idh/MocA family oxidoreductase [Candidatus Sigynarchaeota archaeon]